jgi:hypothetical protein
MCEVSGNRGILVLIRQLPTGPSNRPPAGRYRRAARGRGAGAQTRRAARGVENLN